MTVHSDNQSGRESASDFVTQAGEKFSFLRDLGYLESGSSTTDLKYLSRDIEVHVYLEPRSYELGFEIVRQAERYSLSEIIRLADPEAAERYRDPIVTTQQSLVNGLGQLGELVKRYGARALRGEAEFFLKLKLQRNSWSEGYALEVLAGQLRPRAREAFRQGDYGKAAELYHRIRPCLSPAELRKLAIANQHCQNQARHSPSQFPDSDS